MTGPGSTTRWQRVATDDAGPTYAEAYARRFADAEAAGDDVHGEAGFLARLLAGLTAGPARVLDAGCGTGRVAVRLAGLGHDVVGVDVDDAMLEVARRDAPALPWRRVDLAAVPADLAGFDLVVLAGNVVPLCEAGTLPAVAAGCVRAVRPGGLVVSGFGLDEEHLPEGCPVTPLADWDAACAAAGLVLRDRFDAWDAAARPSSGAPDASGASGASGDGYAVSVHVRPTEPGAAR
ncbi:bifunctional 2-polyprenyl-6-hydroxyphenol methylase/3-demethylubiquinol 3-O-methyltransferase UbiG [Nocardioides sp. CFH 31398]|uniref:class I SAM-dependent methyltransferase n=1 Tax=Nocardioides sp. CFH 31398 TaxID=2919579 RepID=UPI001F0660D8|nr:class I SAM-dependent methyltransferase [Nocardioides sp. CFH 31398]MCH1865415.1 class I SAM-dependent methyltransferase [Nocardioides sp. CFH 31398]